MQDDIVSQGVELMLYGMGTVVIFLALLIVATTLMSLLVTRFFPEPVVLESAPAERRSQVHRGDPQLVAVIAAAIQQHRERDGK